MVSLTYGQGLLLDGFPSAADNAVWPETRNNMIDADATPSHLYSTDVFLIECVGDGDGDQWVFYEKDVTNISTSIYTKFKARWKTSDASNGFGASIQLVYTDASSQYLLESSNIPQFGTTWQVTSGDLTAGKTVDKVRLFANDYPDSIITGGSMDYVYYDYLMLYTDDYVLPNTAGGMTFDPLPREALLGVPGRLTDVTQNLGSQNAVVNLSCDLDQGDWLRRTSAGVPIDDIDGQVFLEMAHNRGRTGISVANVDEPWQWLNTGSHQFKVTVYPRFRWLPSNPTSRTLDLTLTEYSLGTKGNETVAERFGIGL